MRTSTHHEDVGISHVLRSDFATLQIDGFVNEFLYLSLDVGNLVVNNSFHGCKDSGF